MLVLISDANVLIDLEIGGIIEHLFRLDATVAVPDILYYEELEEHHPHYVTLGLQLRPLASESLLQVAMWAQQYPKPSRNDLMAFALAVQESGVLLTGDRDLRSAVEKELQDNAAIHIEHHGTFWLMGMMMDNHLLSEKEARVAFTHMQKHGRRLPVKLFEELLQRRRKK